MTIKLGNRFFDLENDQAPDINREFNSVFKTRLESLNLREDSGVSSFIYQSVEHGQVTFSANGSAIVTKSFGFKEKQNKIIYASAHAQSTDVCAHVTDVTSTGITIAIQNVSAGGNISDNTTATITVYYQAIGSNP